MMSLRFAIGQQTVILSDHEILMEIRSGRLAFEPALSEDQISPSAVDLQLSDEFTVFYAPKIKGVTTAVDLAEIESVEKLARIYGEQKTLAKGEKLSLMPRGFVLAYTLERIKLPNYLAARVEGRSSFARLGLSIHQTAPTVHATFEGQLRLEILNNVPYECRLSPGLRICQLILERLGSPSIARLNSPFQNQSQWQ